MDIYIFYFQVVNPKCGNGIPETGEECDCGTPEVNMCACVMRRRSRARNIIRQMEKTLIQLGVTSPTNNYEPRKLYVLLC